MKCRSRTSLFSTAPRARPAARCWPTGACRGCSSSRYAARVTRQKILITGASSGLGAGMARSFAAKGRDLALCARRTDRLDELKAELSQQHPGIKIAVAQLDVNDHEQVPKVFGELSDELGGTDRIIVNAGIGKGAKLGSGSCGPTRRPSRPTWWPRSCRSRPRWRCSPRAGSGHTGAHLLGARQQGRPGREGCVRGEQGRGGLTGRIAARRIRQGPHQDLGDQARLHRVGDRPPSPTAQC